MIILRTNALSIVVVFFFVWVDSLEAKNDVLPISGTTYVMIVALDTLPPEATDFNKLCGIESAAKEVEQTMKKQSWKVVIFLGRAAQRISILKALKELVDERNVSSNDRVFFWYFGHGITEAAIAINYTVLRLQRACAEAANDPSKEVLSCDSTRETVLFPVWKDSLSNDLAFIALPEIIDILNQESTRELLRFVFIYACLSGNFSKQGFQMISPQWNPHGLENGFYLISSAKEKVIQDSQYLAALQQALSGCPDNFPIGNNDGKVSYFEFANYLTQFVDSHQNRGMKYQRSFSVGHGDPILYSY